MLNKYQKPKAKESSEGICNKWWLLHLMNTLNTHIQVAMYSNLILATTSNLQEAMVEATEISNSAF